MDRSGTNLLRDVCRRSLGTCRRDWDWNCPSCCQYRLPPPLHHRSRWGLSTSRRRSAGVGDRSSGVGCYRGGRGCRQMALNPLPPPTQTLTLGKTPKIPPDIPPDPSISTLFPENTPYRVPDNPFRGPTAKRLRVTHKIAFQDAIASVREPLLFNPVKPYTFDSECVGGDTPSDSFNSAIITVIAAIERGYCSNRDPAPLGPSDWARLCSSLFAAVGRGYHRQYTPDQEAALEKTRAGATDPDPLLRAYPTYFHRLGATAEEVAFQLGVDANEGSDGYQSWYSTLKADFTRKATKAAAAEVDQKWLA